MVNARIARNRSVCELSLRNLEELERVIDGQGFIRQPEPDPEPRSGSRSPRRRAKGVLLAAVALANLPTAAACNGPTLAISVAGMTPLAYLLTKATVKTSRPAK